MTTGKRAAIKDAAVYCTLTGPLVLGFGLLLLTTTTDQSGAGAISACFGIALVFFAVVAWLTLAATYLIWE